jgi:hypothetical protein
MLELKSDVRINGLKPELLLGIMIVHSVFVQTGKHCTITSVTEGKHSWGSLHYAGYACDFRIKTLTEVEQGNVYRLCDKMLGADFDFVKEVTHFHLEYQPKESFNA